MTPAISLDFETFSSTDLRALGAYKYAEGRDTEVLVAAVQRHGTDEILTWDARQDHNRAIELLEQAITDKWEIHAFNAQFEWVILKYVCTRQFGFRVPDINTIRCTAAVCRSAGIPSSLAKSSSFLKLPIQKDTVGKRLINLFSVPQKDGKRIHWHTDGQITLAGEKVTHAEAFQKFVDYCVQDVRTEVAVADAMRSYALKGFPLEWFQLDMRLNDRGVPVDTTALQAAHEMFVAKEEQLASRFREITGLNPSQRDRCFEWFQSNGYKQPKLDKKNRAVAMESKMEDHVKEALAIKEELGYAAVKKIPSMLQMAMEDGRIRGSFLWCGAQKTWRWTSKTPQWQNMKKPPKWIRPHIESIYQTIKNRELDLDCFECVYGPSYEIIACLARYFVRYEDQNIFDLDYSSVEARILPELIGAKRILDKITSGSDIYVSTAQALEIALKEKHKVDFSIDRDTGKTIVLATQFQGGWHAVFTATGEKWRRSWCETAAAIVRKENPEFPAAWKAFQNAFVEAMDNPHKWIKATDYVSFAYVTKGPFKRILMKLPSGRNITYPLPEKKPITMVKVIVVNPKTQKDESVKWERVAGHLDDEEAAESLGLGDPFLYPNARLDSSFHTWEISFYGHIEGALYGRVPTYGGDLLQSATQATGADLLAYGALSAERAGFKPFFLVHDQALAIAEGDKDDFERAMCSIPPWFEGFPLEAEADIVRSYCKS